MYNLRNEYHKLNNFFYLVRLSFFLFPHVEVGGDGLVITEADLLILSLWCLENWNLNKLMDVHCIIKKNVLFLRQKN